MIKKKSWNLIEPVANMTKHNQNWQFRCYLPLMIISMQKFKDIDWFFPVTLVINESCNLIGRETQLATPNQMR